MTHVRNIFKHVKHPARSAGSLLLIGFTVFLQTGIANAVAATTPSTTSPSPFATQSQLFQENIGYFNVAGSCDSSGGDGTQSDTGNDNNKPTIVLDPGHAPKANEDVDPTTKEPVFDYENDPEMAQVWQVAQDVQTKLQQDGYKVLITKNSVDDSSTNLKKRAEVGNQANADLGVSLHTNPGASQVYYPGVGEYLVKTTGQHDTFNDQQLSDTDKKAATTMANDLHQVENTPWESGTYSSFYKSITRQQDGITMQGTMLVTQYFAKIPWIYVEQAQDASPAVTPGTLSKYEQGVIKGIEDIVPTSGTNTSPTSGSGDQSCCSSDSGLGVDSDTSGSDSGVWNSGLSPPYIVEEYAVEILKDLAAKKNVPESDAVTKEHVLALVAWSRIEGGDLMNSSLFNLYNTGYSSPDLDAGAHTADGLGSYKSFDAGVEATARTIASGHGGMLKVLLDPNSTAKDFAHAESYTGTSAYPGTMIWSGAGADDPYGYEHSTWDPMIQMVRSDYKDTAALIIGTPAYEEQDNKTDPSKLQPDLAGGTTDPSSGSDCVGGVSGQGAQAIVQEALKLAWPDGSHGNTPTPAYRQALNQYNPTNYTGDVGNDCGVFVSTVVRAAGVDKNYPVSGTGAQWQYVVSHPNLYSVQYNVTSMNDLQPGDILIIGGPNGAGADAHTWIYVGKQPGGFISASASEGSRTGNLDNDTLTDSRASGNYMRVRVLN